VIGVCVYRLTPERQLAGWFRADADAVGFVGERQADDDDHATYEISNEPPR
jgi:hypothetical protein